MDIRTWDRYKRALPRARAIGLHTMALCMVTTTGPLLYGCATTDELDAIKTTMSANKRSVETRLRQLEHSKQKLEDRQAEQAKHLEDSMTRASELDNRYQTTLDDHARTLSLHQESMARLSDTVRNSAGELRDVRQSLQNEEAAISRILDTEEAFHKEGLRSVQMLRNDLASAPSQSGKSRRTVTRRGTDDTGVDERLLR